MMNGKRLMLTGKAKKNGTRNGVDANTGMEKNWCLTNESKTS